MWLISDLVRFEIFGHICYSKCTRQAAWSMADTRLLIFSCISRYVLVFGCKLYSSKMLQDILSITEKAHSQCQTHSDRHCYPDSRGLPVVRKLIDCSSRTASLTQVLSVSRSYKLDAVLCAAAVFYRLLEILTMGNIHC